MQGAVQVFSTENVKLWFEGFTDSFKKDGGLPQMLLLKKKHSRRVASICSAMADAMEWGEHADSWLAYTTGLLHDAGRFQQYKEYRTFNDSTSIDHGDLAEEILKEQFCWEGITNEIKDIVLTAVKFHNKKDVPTNIPLGTYRWVSLVRDADKIDIYRMVQDRINKGTIYEILPEHNDVDGLSGKLVEEIERSGKGSYSNARSLPDYRLIQLTWGCDLNFPVSVVSLKEEGIFELICNDLKPWGIDGLLAKLLKKIDDIQS